MKKQRIRSDLLRKFVLYVLLLFVVFVAVILYFFTTSNVELSKDRNEDMVELIQRQISSSFIPPATEIKSKYSVYKVQGVAFSGENLAFVTELEILDYDGIVIEPLCGHEHHRGLDKSNLPIVQDILEADLNTIVYGTTLVDSTTGVVQTGFGFRSEEHVILAYINIDSFEELIGRDLLDSVVVSIVDENGSYIYNEEPVKVNAREVDPNFHDASNGIVLSGDLVEYNDENYYIHTSFIPETSWTVLIYQSQSVIIEPIISMALLILVAIFVMILFIILVINSILKRLENNLASFSSAADSIYEGQYDLIDYENQYEEFQSVSIKMNEMINQINIREKKIMLLNDRLELSYLNTLTVLTKAIEAKDSYTGNHCERVSYYALLIGEKLGLNDEDMYELKYGSLLHDIGKISIPETILTKPGRLDDDEYKQIKDHSSKGYILVRDLPSLEKAKEIVLYHHERYDGRGYPNGLVGEDIPLLARIVCIADAFDAMTSNRIYRDGVKMKEQAFEELKNCAGTQFDARLVDEFIASMNELDEI